ncbi:phosphotransferase family protein [Paenibacillus lautus]|uniref:phosphotransferase family protein n=1 Tax=Paenibacillus lautus TaxID=1401 RepID=UPI000FDB0931|nr:aminoglycoside phosphotransferase family protein [Paenibacillus lautus]
MTTEIFFSTNPIGHVTDEQLQTMLNRHRLGTLISAEKTSKGVGNQTLFIHSSKGSYVLKGNPIYEGQFAEEKFYTDSLQEYTTLPLSAPYMLDESGDIFGWSYAIMPRLHGVHMNDSQFRERLAAADRLDIASSAANMLNEMHGWKVEQYGELDPKTQRIHPFEGSYKEWLYHRIRFWLQDAKQYSQITPTDTEWVEGVLRDSADAFDKHCSPTFVMGDFKADNMLVAYDTVCQEWRISGIFDFTTGYFGDGVADLPKMVIMYWDFEEQEVARHFIQMYLQGSAIKEGFVDRFRVHMLHQRILDWGCAKAMGAVTWDPQLTFSEWAKDYVYAMDYLK